MESGVEIPIHLGQTPTIRFLGRADATVDLVGEKLSEAFVESVLAQVFGSRSRPQFAMLAPDPIDGRPGYTLYLDGRLADPDRLLTDLTRELRQNPHFACAQDLGQLGPLRLFVAHGDAQVAYLRRLTTGGKRLGDIKPTALSNDAKWSETLAGHYVNSAQSGVASVAVAM